MALKFKKENAVKYLEKNPFSFGDLEVIEKPVAFSLKVSKEDNQLINKLSELINVRIEKKSRLVNYLIESIVFDFFNHLDNEQKYFLSKEMDVVLEGKSNFSWVKFMGSYEINLAEGNLYGTEHSEFILAQYEIFINEIKLFVKKHKEK